MSKHIFFEGPECGGKTSIMAIVGEELSAEMHKGVRIPGRLNMITKVTEDLRRMRAGSQFGADDTEADTEYVIYDRHVMFSDIIYEKYIYGTASVVEPFLSEIGSVLRKNNGVIVFLLTTKQEMVKRFRFRGDKLRTEEEACVAYDAYKKFIEDMQGVLPCVVIDTTGLQAEQSAVNCLDFISEYFSI